MSTSQEPTVELFTWLCLTEGCKFESPCIGDFIVHLHEEHDVRITCSILNVTCSTLDVEGAFGLAWLCLKDGYSHPPCDFDKFAEHLSDDYGIIIDFTLDKIKSRDIARA